jgi:ABC-type transport system involved in multi-copper enzyme maturation permease subunit
MMNWLLWKEYRQNRLAFFSALTFMSVPHLVVLYLIGKDLYRGVHDPSTRWLEMFVVSTLFSLIVSQASIAVIGGNAFAGERADRSAEFLASLPISRGASLVSKLLLSLILIVAIWLPCLSLMEWLLSQCKIINGPGCDELWRMVGYTAVTAMMFFGVSWCLSSFLTSPMTAVLGGLIAPAILWFGILYIGYLTGNMEEPRFYDFAEVLYGRICLLSAPIPFVVGTWYYLRRIEP